MEITIINGPNLNLLGIREQNIYGSLPFSASLQSLKEEYSEIELVFFQSNHEGDLIDKIQEAGFSSDGIILNAGGFSHTSIAIRDAISAVPAPVVEVHISNIFAREEFRHTSVLSAVCEGVIVGFGIDVYRLGIESLKVKTKRDIVGHTNKI